MRDYHFRAWDKAKGKWIDGAYGFHILGESMLIGGLFQDYKIEDLNNIVIEQFTGLLDKQGKEIYEGDVVKSTKKAKEKVLNGRPPKKHSSLRKLHGKTRVIFDEGSFFIKKKSKRGMRFPLNSLAIRYLKLEIIGNIHKNPKLLETERKTNA